MVGSLLHRDAELAAIGEVAAEVSAGRPASLVIEGERGTGKTALLYAAARRAHEIGTLLLARCHPSEQDFPFAMLRQLFDRPDPPPSEPVHGTLDGYFQTARTLATRRPVIIALDDIGAADLPSLRWGAYLARRLHQMSVALIVTRQADDRAGDELVSDLRSVPFHRSIRPRPLCGACTSELLAEEYGVPVDGGLATACHELARGNPLVLRNLARRLREAAVPPDGPPERVREHAVDTLAATTVAWLGERDPGALELAEFLAVLGDRGDLATAAVLAGQGEAAAARARPVLRRAGLLGGDPPDRFGHRLVRDAVLKRAGASRREELHDRAATLLFRLGAPARHAADHLVSVGPAGRDWAVPVLSQAAREAGASGEWPEAAGYLLRALTEYTDPEPELSSAVLADLAAVELQYHLPACARHVDAAIRLAPDAELRCRAALTVANPVFALCAPASAGAFAEVADHLAGPGRTADRHGHQLLLATAQALLAGEASTARTATRLAAAAGHPPRQAFSAALAVVSAATGARRARVQRLVSRCGGVPGPDSPSLALCALAQAWAEAFADAERLAKQAVRTAASAPEEALARLVGADLACRRGELAAALEPARDAARLANQSGATDLATAAAALAARVHLERGETDDARALLGRTGGSASHPLLWSTHALAAGMLAAVDGDDAGALRWFVACGQRLTAAGVTNPACSPWRTLAATAHLALGQPEAARVIALDEVRLARRWGARGTLGRALSTAAATRGARAGLNLQLRAVDLLAGPDHRLEYARALVRLGTAHHNIGSKQAAREVFGRARKVARECGAARLAQEAGARTRRPRPPTRGTDAPGTAVMTNQELRVAELVAAGLSNLEVANALLISKRTVDTHLVHMYRKLGIRSRRQLIDILGGDRARTD